MLFIAVFAFFLASFPARNSDLWGHLAAGRNLTPAGFSGASDSQVAPPSANQNWLYDLLSYGLYLAMGGTGLVFVKALLVAGLGLVLLCLSRSGSGWSIPALCTALTLLTMSTRLLLQPVTGSYLLLALTLWFLWRRGAKSATQPISILPPWQLIVLFVVWANFDSGFLFGLGTAALVLVGQVLDASSQRQMTQSAGQSKPWRSTSGVLPVASCLLVLAAACLLNPSHLYAFGLPPEFAWLGRSDSSTASGAGLVLSPFSRAYFSTLGLSPAGLAYFPVLGLGLVAFVLNIRRWQWQRFLPWLGLGLLSAVQVKAIPFFAVVAGPVLAWNLQEILSANARPEVAPNRHRQRGLLALRAVTVVLGLAFLLWAWPGWLQAPPFEPRRCAIETSASLERGATTIRRWHEEGKLGTLNRGLHLSPETANAFAWFCPQESGLLDPQFSSLLLDSSRNTAVSPDGDGVRDELHDRFRSLGAHHLIVYDADRSRLLRALDQLLADPDRWPLLYLQGDLAIFGWRDPARPDASTSFQGWELDLNQLAFGSAGPKKAPREVPSSEPEPRPWWDAFWNLAPPRPIDRDEATLYLLHAEALRRSAPRRLLALWEASQSAGIVSAAPSWACPSCFTDAAVRLAILRPHVGEPGTGQGDLSAFDRQVLAWQRRFTFERDDTPPALLYLAVRASRKALALNPQDAQAYLILGESYLRLLHNTRERAWIRRMPEVAQLRRAQASAALNQAIARKPDLGQAHLNLAALYREMGYLDLMLHHSRAYFRLTRRGNSEATNTGEFRARRAQEEEDLNRMAGGVAAKENSFVTEAAGLRVLDRAILAGRKGLAGRARDILLESDVAAFGPAGMEMELELLLNTGRAKDVSGWTGPAQKATLNEHSYHLLRVQALAALGDYAWAEDECALLASAEAGAGQVEARQAIALSVGQALLDEQTGAAPVPILSASVLRRGKFRDLISSKIQRLREEADATVLRGLLLLEEGEVDQAKAAFRGALACWKDEASAASGSGLDFKGRAIAQGCLGWLQEAAGGNAGP
jgi:hypothetical protein